jgi:exodeoxyribonuclease-1
MMPTTLFWHDYETSGVDPARDRPLQFAGIRTDEDLNIIGEPVTDYSLPPLDRLPHPQACLITGLTPQFLLEKGRAEPEFIAAVHSQMSKPGTCSVGYNNIRFDDEVTRFTLYRNFFDPYEREWKNGNSRWDIIDMLRLTRALRPSGVEWPDHDDGAPSFRLEDMTAANGIDHGDAHDALADVQATIAIARLIKNKQPRLYDYVYLNRSKKRANTMIDLAGRKPFLHVSSRLPRENGYLAIMMPICVHPTNGNAIVAINLMSDPRSLFELDSEEIRERLFTRGADLPTGVERVALKGIHLNRCPVLATTRLLDSSAARRLGIDLGVCEQHWRLLLDNDISNKVREVFAGAEYSDPQDAEVALYTGFMPDSDKHMLAKVRQLDAQQLATADIVFKDDRYNELLFRYRASNAPETLNANEKQAWQELCLGQITGDKQGFINLKTYNEELDTLGARPNLPSQDKLVIRALRDWCNVLLSKYGLN